VHAPEGGREDLDALLLEIDRPLAAGEDARHRAAQLRRIVADTWLAEFTGTDGRRTDEAAAQALRALGEPSTEALSTEGQEAIHPVPLTPADAEGLSWRHVVGVLALAMGLYEGHAALGATGSLGPVLSTLSAGLTVILPALVLMVRPAAHNRMLYLLGTLLAALAIPYLVLMTLVTVGLRTVYASAQDGTSTLATVFTFVLVRGGLVASLCIARLTKGKPS
jgi:hypothetical protein